MFRHRINKIRKLKLRYKLLIGFALGWCYVFLIGGILLQSSEFRGYLKSKLIAELEKNLHAKVSIGEISGNIFSRVRIRNVQITSAINGQQSTLKNLFTAEQVSVRFSLWEAFQGNLGFAHLQLIRPKLILYTETFTQPRHAVPERMKPRIQFRWIQLESATVELHHRDKTYALEQFNFAGSISYTDPKLYLAIRKCSGTIAGIPIQELRGSLRLDDKQVVVQNLRVTGKNIQLVANGTIIGYNSTEPTVNLELNATKLPLQNLVALHPVSKSIPLTGTAKCFATIIGSGKNLTGTGELFIPEGSYTSIPFSEFHMRFSISTGIITFDRVKCSMFGGTVTASATVSLQNERVETPTTTRRNDLQHNQSEYKFSLAVKAENIALDKFQVRSSATREAQSKISGSINSELEMTGNLTSPKTWTGTGRVTWMNGRYKKITVTVAESRFSIATGYVALQETRIQTPELTAVGSGLFKPSSSEYRFRVQVTALNLSLLNQMTNLPECSGQGTAEFELIGSVKTVPRITGTFIVNNGTVGRLQFASLSGQMTAENEMIVRVSKLRVGDGMDVNGNAELKFLEGNQLQIISARLTRGDSELAGSGTIDLTKKLTTFQFSGKSMSLADVSQLQAILPNIAGKFNLDGTITGPFTAPVISSRVFLYSITANRQPISDLTGTLSYQMAQKSIELDLTGAGYRLQGNIVGVGQDPNYHFLITAQRADFRLIAAVLRFPVQFASAQLTGSGTISGKKLNLLLSGNCQTLDLILAKSNQKVSVVDGTYSGKISGKSGNIQLIAGAVKAFETNYKRNTPTTQDLIASLDNIKTEFSWANENQNNQIQGNGIITAVHGTISSIPITNLQLQLQLDSGKLTVANSRFRSCDGIFDLTGTVKWMTKPSSYQFSATIRNMQANTLLRYLPGTDRFRDATGLINASLNISGSEFDVTTFVGKGNLSLSQVRIMNRNIDSITATVEISRDKLLITSANLTHNHTTASLTGWFDRTQHLDIIAKGNTDDLTQWLPKTKGAAQFTLHWTNTLQAPVLFAELESDAGGYGRILWEQARIYVQLSDAMQGTITFSSDRIHIGTQQFDRATANILLKDPVVEMSQFEANLSDGGAHATGKVNLQTGVVTLTLTGKKLDLLSLLFSGKQAPLWESGDVYLQGEFNGNYKQHTATAIFHQFQIVSKAKSWGLGSRPTLVNGQDVIITWQNDRVLVPVAKFTDGTGTFTLQGEIELTPEYRLKNYVFTLQGQDVTWPILRGLQAVYHPQLSLRKTTTGTIFSGDFLITKADINGPIMFAPSPVNIPKSNHVTNFKASPLELDLLFRAQDKLHLKTNLLEVDGKGWIKLTGPANEPKVEYEFRSVGGAVFFRGYKFQIVKAEAKPFESNSFNPLLDLFAQRKIRTMDVNLRFYGTLQDYEITLTSDPPLEQSDIMALLATGKTTEELRTATGTGSERVAYGLAAGYIGEEILNTIGNPLVRAVGIDRVGVDYETSNEPRVKVEKDLGKRVTVSYSMGVTKNADPKAQVELQLGKHLSLIGSTGQNTLTQTATGAVDLELKFRTK
ncbi:MAG: translocation/assembly module TamB domain-containing protein [bacterium]|nr:translocation/assembly module TamB domain-containing protein [bacterium]